MNKILITTLFFSSLMSVADEIKSYAQAKHKAYLIVKDYPGIFSSQIAKDLQQKQAETLHKLAYEVSQSNNEVKELLQQKEGAFRYAKESGDYGDFHSVIKELENYIMKNIKNEATYQELYSRWDNAVLAVEQHRLSKVKDSDKSALLKVYKFKQKERKPESNKSITLNI